jgi:N-acetylneuraminate synthase
MSVFIIAEAGVNHNGDIDTALALIDAAAKAGADAVKFQTFKAGDVISVHAEKANYQKHTTNVDESQLDMVRKLELSYSTHHQLAAHCRDRGIAFLSTPFDLGSLDFLVTEMKLGILKISSGEITNAPLLLAAARSGCKVIMSTGMSTIDEVQDALGVLAFGYGPDSDTNPGTEAFAQAFKTSKRLPGKVALLHCTTEYPSPYEDANLRAMDTLREAFGLKVGLSDHTPGIAIPIAAVGLGASVVEKHFTLDRTMAGPDHAASLEQAELVAMVAAIRATEAALGDGVKRLMPSEAANREIARKSLVARVPIAAGEMFTDDNLTSKRPGTGLSPMMYWSLVGTRAQRAYKADEELDG